jgi:hypothetical protein
MKRISKNLDIAEYTDPLHNPMTPTSSSSRLGSSIIYMGYRFFGRRTLQELRQDLHRFSRNAGRTGTSRPPNSKRRGSGIFSISRRDVRPKSSLDRTCHQPRNSSQDRADGHERRVLAYDARCQAQQLNRQARRGRGAAGQGLKLIGSVKFQKEAAAVTRDGLMRRSVHLFSVCCL